MKAEAKALVSLRDAVEKLVNASLQEYCPWREGAKPHSPDGARPCFICRALTRFGVPE